MTRARRVPAQRANALLRSLEAGVHSPLECLRLQAALERSLERVRRRAGAVDTWEQRLAAECQRSGQREVASRLRVSQATLSLILNGRYPASTKRIRARVEQSLPAPAPARPPKFDSAAQRSAACWGGARPDWIARLAEACDRGSQSEVGRALGVSGSVVNQVLGNRYRGDMERVQAWVEALYPADPSVEHVVRCAFLVSMPDLPGVVREDTIARIRCLQTQDERVTDPAALSWREACRDCAHALSRVRGRPVRITQELRR